MMLGLLWIHHKAFLFSAEGGKKEKVWKVLQKALCYLRVQIIYFASSAVSTECWTGLYSTKIIINVKFACI